MNQRLVKVTVIFFSLMVVFTILSRTAYNLGTVEVTVKTSERMTMSAEIKGSGTVDGKLEQAIVTEGGLLIKTVYVSAGDIVEKDTVLYELDLDALQQKIDEMNQEIRVKELQIQDMKNSAQEQDSRHQLALSQAQSDYNRAVAEGDDAVAQAETRLSQAWSDYENFVNNRAMYPDQTEEIFLTGIEEKQKLYDEAVKSREVSIYGVQKALDSASLETAQNSSAEQAENNKEQVQKELDKLSGLMQAGGQIKSPVKGKVSEVSVKAGSSTSGEGDVLLVDASSGMQLTVEFPGKYRQYFQEGKTVNVVCEGTLEEILVKLKKLQIVNITSSESQTSALPDNMNSENQTSTMSGEDTGEGVRVTVDIPPGTLNIGDVADIEVKLASNTYDICIPYSALHLKEKDKYYVNVMEEKNSVLGISWVVRRIDVELLEENGQYAAVKGLSGSQEVIIESSRELLEGSRVKRREL